MHSTDAEKVIFCKSVAFEKEQCISKQCVAPYCATSKTMEERTY